MNKASGSINEGRDMYSLIVTVDAIKPQLSGIGRYTWEIAKRAAALDRVSKISYYDRGKFVNDLDGLRKGIRPPKDPWLVREIRKLANPMMKTRPRFTGAVFHSTNFFLPDRVENGVVTIHDVSVLKFPETHPLDRIKQYERYFDDTLKRTAHVITVSEHARREIVDVLGLHETKVTAIHLGVDEAYRDARRVVEGAEQSNEYFYGLESGSYTLCVSTLEPRKNIDKLLTAYSHLSNEVKSRFPLVLVGAVGWLSDKLEAQIASLKSEGWLRVLGYVPETDLPFLYARARLFAYPSMYEGFGLPVAEAMAAGVPVITSDQSSLPEVAAGAAAIIDPNDIKEFSAVLRRGLEDDVWRRDARARGFDVSDGYLWQRCAERTGEIYQRVHAACRV
ncbi:glycosyltransferase family 4 protein [Burkholderia cepacia]|nr:glycosyltransferase family 1 protein [Burkholderia cepacia]MCA8346066.1 glycosyltransferase family 4 protein [Burkholderia cepacia]MDO5940724.1 glycosyltransferase family 1 protein [Burkholderia cepacia]